MSGSRKRRFFITSASGLVLDQIVEPAPPAAGKIIVFAGLDGMLYMKDDLGVVTQLGAGNVQIEEVFTGEAALLGVDTLFSFLLGLKPASTGAVRLYVNGAVQRNGQDYIVGGLDDKRVTWLSNTGTADFAIQVMDHITVAYEPI